jgi:hypothetical protein
MPLPMLSATQVEWVIQQVAAYIEQQRQMYRPGAAPLIMSHKTAMRPFFPEPVLDSTRLVVLAGQRVNNPPFYSELIKIGFEPASLPDFAHMAAITFVDTVVSHEPLTNRILFHELVHVVQYEKLGLMEFAAKYVRGFVLIVALMQPSLWREMLTNWMDDLRLSQRRLFLSRLRFNRGYMGAGSSRPEGFFNAT